MHKENPYDEFNRNIYNNHSRYINKLVNEKKKKKTKKIIFFTFLFILFSLIAYFEFNIKRIIKNFGMIDMIINKNFTQIKQSLFSSSDKILEGLYTNKSIIFQLTDKEIKEYKNLLNIFSVRNIYEILKTNLLVFFFEKFPIAKTILPENAFFNYIQILTFLECSDTNISRELEDYFSYLKNYKIFEAQIKYSKYFIGTKKIQKKFQELKKICFFEDVMEIGFSSNLNIIPECISLNNISIHNDKSNFLEENLILEIKIFSFYEVKDRIILNFTKKIFIYLNKNNEIQLLDGVKILILNQFDKKIKNLQICNLNNYSKEKNSKGIWIEFYSYQREKQNIQKNINLEFCFDDLFFYY